MEIILINVQSDGTLPDKFQGLLNGKKLTAEKSVEKILEFMPSIRRDAIEMFDAYFRKNSSFDELIKDYESGNGEATKIMRFIGIFPVEAANIRSEIVHPQYLKQNAQFSNGNRRITTLLVSVMGDLYQEFKGPNLPPAPAKDVVSFLKTHVPQLDQNIRNQIINPSAGTPNDGYGDHSLH